MKTYILIGGIGSGKSTVCTLLNRRGACTLDLDVLGHEVLEIPSVAAALVRSFGETLIDPFGKVDRKRLAEAAFAQADGAEELGRITHPAITQQALACLREFEARGCCIAVVEASAYAGPDALPRAIASLVNGVVAVVAEEEVRVKRAVLRGMAEGEVRTRMDAQPSQQQLLAWADHVIDNSGSREDLVAQVDALWAQLT